ncbi:hypothetical protein J8I87_17975 [Paraburkholderia sp. LEh10]|uniref:hypothetical protein n=1 Tax=Paraburkholderia sp. LEh10 TaxID=2821353 RepID=UPI001AE1F5B2|nr:hypothetical protein [Paraburkholderia sp. LEh10]MBP0591580.1 hypothetical protein [Paraburkholderia sp. LEh10]
MHDREIKAPPYRIILNAAEEWVPHKPQGSVLDGYRSIASISRLDGRHIFEGMKAYWIGFGCVFGSEEGAIQDCERRARDAIKDGFPR